MQLVGKKIIQRNHRHNQEIGSLYHFLTKNLYNNTSCRMQDKFIHLPMQTARRLQLPSDDYILKFLLELQTSTRLEYKNRLTDKLIKKFNLLKCKVKNPNRYLSVYLTCTEINMKIKITEILIGFVIIDNLLYRYHGKFKVGDKYRLVFAIGLLMCKLLSHKVQLAKLKNLLQNCLGNTFSRFYPNHNLASKYGKGFAYKHRFCVQEIITGLYQIGDKLLIHADINDSLNISRKLVPIAFSSGI